MDTGKAGVDTCEDVEICEDEDVDRGEDVDTVDCERSICLISPFKTDITWLIGFSAVLELLQKFTNFEKYLKFIVSNKFREN